MPRAPRQKSESGIYHIMIRGINQQAIFEDEEDNQKFIEKIVTKNVLIAGIVSCQFISNVPTAIFISKFTKNYTDLLVAVNIGSLGIIISSLASLITLKEFLKHQPQNFKKYMLKFTIINSTFLFVTMVVTLLK